MQKLSGDQRLLMNLPAEITIDILSRLSTKTIIKCLCVCKTWHKLLSSQEFGDLRSLRPPPYLVIHKNTSSFNLVELEDEPNYHDFYHVPGTNNDHPKGLEINCTSLFGSINGLLCFKEFGYHKDSVYVWNPTMGECIMIPSAGGLMEYPNIESYGFGLSPVTGHYKIVRIFQELERDSRRILSSNCHVYTLGEASWRGIGHAPFLYSCRSDGVFLKGNLHWMVYDPDGPEFISCFNLEEEVFKPFPAPELNKDFNLSSLELYQDFLSVCDNSSDFETVIWVMKDYGIKSSWSKQFVIDKNLINLVGCYYEVVHILKVFKDGEILLLWDNSACRSYNPQRKTLVKIGTEKLVGLEGDPYSDVDVMDYVPSFFSLKKFELEMVENTF